MQQNRVRFKVKDCRLLVFMLSIVTHFAFSQDIDSTKSIKHIGGAVTVTNNGVSLLPTFSLGKPAALFDLTLGNKKLSFEPQFRFALEGKPWSFIFWWRYKLLNSNKFQINVGAHPAVLFKTVSITSNGVTTETIEAQRYLAAELAPSYFLKKDISIGMYYLHSNGFAESGIKNTDFITVNSNFSNIKLSKQFYMKFYPQIYYLKMDQQDGYYVTATVTLAKRLFPLSLQSIVNQTIKTDIPAKSDFVWNVSLIYSVRNEYVKR